MSALRMSSMVLAGVIALSIVTVTSAAPVFELMPSARYFVDADARLDTTAARALPDAQFTANADVEINFGISPAAYWVRLLIPPQAAALDDCVLVIPFPLLDLVTVHLQVGDEHQRLYGGDNRSYASRALRHRFNVFPLPVCTPGTKILIEINSASTVRLRARLMDMATLAGLDAERGFSLGIFYGLMIALFLYNLMLVFADYDASRVYYLAYLLCATAIAAVLDGLPNRYPPFESWPAYANSAALFIAHLLLFFGLRFVRAFVRLEGPAPIGDRALQTMSWITLGCAALALGWGGVGAQRLLQATVLMTMVVIASAIIGGAFKGNRQARVLLVVFAGLGVPAVLWSAQSLGLVQLGVLGDSMLQLGIGLEALLLSFALAERIRFLARQQFEAEQRVAQERQAFSRRLLDAREEQQREFARELHDAIGQNVLALKTSLDRWGRESAGAAGKRYSQASVLAGEIVNSARELAHRLHPSVLDRLGLAQALTGLVSGLDQAGIDVTVRLDPAIDALPRQQAVHVYRLFQEAVTNMVRHAHASRASFLASRSGRRISISLADDGRGIDPVATRGLGMNAMRERAHIIGGNLSIDTGEGGGTRIALDIDLGGDAGDADMAPGTRTENGG